MNKVMLYLLCLFAQTALLSAVGAVLIFFTRGQLVPQAIGWGILAYALAVAIYTLLSVWRLRRASG